LTIVFPSTLTLPPSPSKLRLLGLGVVARPVRDPENRDAGMSVGEFDPVDGEVPPVQLSFKADKVW
jgi:hypothetical protein